MEAMDMYQYERALTGGATPFCGVDEAGPRAPGRTRVRGGGVLPRSRGYRN